jgi:transposase
MDKTRVDYPAEFRRQMVDLVHAGRAPEELAREFEPTAQSIRNWVAQSARDTGLDLSRLSPDEQKTMAQLLMKAMGMLPD